MKFSFPRLNRIVIKLRSFINLKIFGNLREKETVVAIPKVAIPKSLTTYYFVLASDKFLLVEEPVEEILRERVQHYRRIKKPTDFWIVQSPAFLDSEQLSELRTQLKEAKLPEEHSAIVSTDKSFITWLKLRLNNVAIGSFTAPTDDIPSPLASKRKATKIS